MIGNLAPQPTLLHTAELSVRDRRLREGSDWSQGPWLVGGEVRIGHQAVSDCIPQATAEAQLCLECT